MALWSSWPASKASKLKTFCIERRSHRWDRIPLILLRKYFKRGIKPSTICQSRLRLSANTWKQSIWCQFCLPWVLLPWAGATKRRGNKGNQARVNKQLFLLHVWQGMNGDFCTGTFPLRRARFLMRIVFFFINKHRPWEWLCKGIIIHTSQSLHSCSFWCNFSSSQMSH